MTNDFQIVVPGRAWILLVHHELKLPMTLDECGTAAAAVGVFKKARSVAPKIVTMPTNRSAAALYRDNRRPYGTH